MELLRNYLCLLTIMMMYKWNCSQTNNNMEYVVVIVGFCDGGQDLSELCAHLTISAEARNSILSWFGNHGHWPPRF